MTKHLVMTCYKTTIADTIASRCARYRIQIYSYIVYRTWCIFTFRYLLLVRFSYIYGSYYNYQGIYDCGKAPVSIILDNWILLDFKPLVAQVLT